MVSWALSRLIELLFGMLYPAYASYKAVKTKNIREYVHWMMYWIVFALFMATETFTDLLISWFPFYYEVKMAFVIWLLSPYTRGASLLYRKFVHPTLSRKEKVSEGLPGAEGVLRTLGRGAVPPHHLRAVCRTSMGTSCAPGSAATRPWCTSARGASTWQPRPRCRRQPRARACWPGGSAASACRTCARGPRTPRCTARTRCTWRSPRAAGSCWPITCTQAPGSTRVRRRRRRSGRIWRSRPPSRTPDPSLAARACVWPRRRHQAKRALPGSCAAGSGRKQPCRMRMTDGTGETSACDLTMTLLLQHEEGAVCAIPALGKGLPPALHCKSLL
uniref:Receptor expression-enhancing protein n=1 Tax=Amazona collaria TaxID=241587 RepID=A0A8B9IZG0_9PSIT